MERMNVAAGQRERERKWDKEKWLSQTSTKKKKELQRKHSQCQRQNGLRKLQTKRKNHIIVYILHYECNENPLFPIFYLVSLCICHGFCAPYIGRPNKRCRNAALQREPQANGNDDGHNIGNQQGNCHRIANEMQSSDFSTGFSFALHSYTKSDRKKTFEKYNNNKNNKIKTKHT